MNKLVKKLFLPCLLITSLVFISSCASGPRFKKITSIPDDKSIVYFYRPANFVGGGLSPTIYDNGTEILSALSNGCYWVYFTELGKHEFLAKSGMAMGSVVDVDISEPGKEFYIKMNIDPGFWIAQAKLNRIYPEQGQAEILECKLCELPASISE